MNDGPETKKDAGLDFVGPNDVELNIVWLFDCNEWYIEQIM